MQVLALASVDVVMLTLVTVSVVLNRRDKEPGIRRVKEPVSYPGSSLRLCTTLGPGPK